MKRSSTQASEQQKKKAKKTKGKSFFERHGYYCGGVPSDAKIINNVKKLSLTLEGMDPDVLLPKYGFPECVEFECASKNELKERNDLMKDKVSFLHSLLLFLTCTFDLPLHRSLLPHFHISQDKPDWCFLQIMHPISAKTGKPLAIRRMLCISQNGREVSTKLLNMKMVRMILSLFFPTLLRRDFSFDLIFWRCDM